MSSLFFFGFVFLSIVVLPMLFSIAVVMVSWSLVHVCWCSGVCFHIFSISVLHFFHSSFVPVFPYCCFTFWYGFIYTYFSCDDMVLLLPVIGFILLLSVSDSSMFLFILLLTIM